MKYLNSGSLIKLKRGANIAIIGAGPAGCFFAIHALRISKAKNLDLKLTIYDVKNFLLTGPPGCNLCAGVISKNLRDLLKQHGVLLEAPKVQRNIRGYFLQTPNLGIQLFHPKLIDSIYSVFRGNGPRFSSPQGNVSFDDLLLQHVIQQGVKHIPELVTDVELSATPDKISSIITLSNGQQRKYSADLVVGAFGLNSLLLRKITAKGFGYKPPKSISTIQAELPLPNDWIEKRFRDNIVVFSYRSKRTRYAVVVPKKGYLSISIINKGDADQIDLTKFLQSKTFQTYLPENYSEVAHFCLCRPRIALSSARNPYCNRLILIGDAGYTRIYKNGIESAYYSALYAAKAALNHGISANHFKKYYHRPMKRLFIRDNLFGRFMFFIYDNIVQHNFLSKVFFYSVLQSPTQKMNRYLRRLVWNMFTGQERYFKIFLHFINPRFQLHMFRNTIESFWKKIPETEMLTLSSLSIQDAGIKIRASNKVLKDGSVVGIVGGGPGGMACAITLKTLARRQGISIKTVIYEGKDYKGIPHYNQCVGVLSPPIRSLLEDQLEIPFPDELVQRYITGYILHSQNNQITLEDREHPSFSVRRITFDDYLMNKAIERDVEVRQSRVTDIEIHSDRVIIYSETDFLKADVVVGAFGLDDASIQIFERVTEYKSPEFLNSIVTKIHPGMEFMKNIGNSIFAFLPSYHQIEFGAITPKHNHLTINIAGKNIDALWMDIFLNYPQVKRILPENDNYDKSSLHYFKGKFPISTAKNFYGNRYVLIGDAAGLVRPFKGKGINSAIRSGIQAAKVMMHEGISGMAFKQYEETCDEILRDITYGNIVRRFTIFSSNYGFLDFLIHFARTNQKMHDALFNSVSAYKYYREILKETFAWSFFKDAVFSFLKYKNMKG